MRPGSIHRNGSVAMRIEDFIRERERQNGVTLDFAGPVTKRFFSLDTQCYRDGALPVKTKELIGLIASLVLRCDDCINYHLLRCRTEGVTDAELDEALSIGIIVGGSITIPHIRRAVDGWKEMAEKDLSL